MTRDPCVPCLPDLIGPDQLDQMTWSDLIQQDVHVVHTNCPKPRHLKTDMTRKVWCQVGCLEVEGSPVDHGFMDLPRGHRGVPTCPSRIILWSRPTLAGDHVGVPTRPSCVTSWTRPTPSCVTSWSQPDPRVSPHGPDPTLVCHHIIPTRPSCVTTWSRPDPRMSPRGPDPTLACHLVALPGDGI